ncbi:MAG: hypothetical protein V1787_03420 [Candidatus Micrarchaeota archaeon]
MAREKRVSPSANAFWTIILIVALAVGAYFLFLAPQPPKFVSTLPFIKPDAGAARAAQVSLLAAEYDPRSLEYFDQNYSFSLRYLQGYLADLDPFPSVRVRFSAYHPPYSAEIIDVRVVESGELSDVKIGEAAAEENASLASYPQDGRTVYVLSMAMQNPVDGNERIFIRQAYLQCPSNWVVLVAAISEPLVPDLDLVDYMISTMRCQ